MKVKIPISTCQSCADGPCFRVEHTMNTCRNFKPDRISMAVISDLNVDKYNNSRRTVYRREEVSRKVSFKVCSDCADTKNPLNMVLANKHAPTGYKFSQWSKQRELDSRPSKEFPFGENQGFCDFCIAKGYAVEITVIYEEE